MHALALIALVATQAASATDAAPLPRRFVLAVGENHGDPQDDPLRYAEADARSFVGTLEAVGGVAPENAMLLLGAPAGDVRAALDQIERRLREQAQPGDQLILYVSSHADEGELHLGGTRLSMAELVDDLKRSPASVAILIVDSCSSGALVRLKGMKPLVGQGPGSTVSVEVPETTGRVIIASSGADESSQESQSLRGSYFTHHLVAGLRGAADAARDGRITLEEAYDYAYARTVESTFGTRAGVQHPRYAVDLKGRGELVLATLQSATSRVVIDTPAAGEWLLTPEGDRPDTYEFAKPVGQAVFAVPPGGYHVQERASGTVADGFVTVPAGGEATVTEGDLHAPLPAYASAKGATPHLTIGLALGASGGVAGNIDVLPAAGVLLRWESSRRFLGFLNLVLASATYAQGSAGATGDEQFSAEAGVGREVDLGAFALRLALEGGGVVLRQTDTPPPSPRLSGAPFLGARAEAALRLAGGLSLLLGGFAGPELIREDDGVHASARLAADLGVGWTL